MKPVSLNFVAIKVSDVVTPKRQKYNWFVVKDCQVPIFNAKIKPEDEPYNPNIRKITEDHLDDLIWGEQNDGRTWAEAREVAPDTEDEMEKIRLEKIEAQKQKQIAAKKMALKKPTLSSVETSRKPAPKSAPKRDSKMTSKKIQPLKKSRWKCQNVNFIRKKNFFYALKMKKQFLGMKWIFVLCIILIQAKAKKHVDCFHLGNYGDCTFKVRNFVRDT